MSDFAGLWRLDGRPVDVIDISRMAEVLAGRGILSPRVWQDGSFAIVHRQHCYTPEDERERMPLAGPSSAVLAADIRLDNRADLLAALGGDCAALPDSAIALAAFEQWGEAAANGLYGEWAIALWQPKDRRLMLTRDPLSPRALFFHRGPRLIAFSTRLATLLSLPEIPNDLDEAVFADHLILNCEPADATPYRFIRKVPRGHIVTLTADAVCSTRWWSLPDAGTRHFSSYEDTVTAAREVLDRAVKASTRAIGPVGTCLTGGLDSTSVTAMAMRHLEPGRLFALTREPDGPTAPENATHFTNEVSRAAAFAFTHPQLDWHRVKNDGADWGEWDRRRWFEVAAVPVNHPVNFAWFMPVYRFVATRGGRVLLLGDCGNAFYSFDGNWLELHLLRQGQLPALWRSLSARARNEKKALMAIALRRLVAPFEPPWLRNWRKGGSRQPWVSHAALNPIFAAEIGMPDRFDSRLRSGVRFRSVRTFRAWAMQDDVSCYAIGPMRAFHGIEYRAPLMERRLVEFFASLPLDVFVKDGVTRSLARDILRGHAPEETVCNRKIGRQLGDWHAILSARRPAMLAALARTRRSPLARRIVDLDRLQRLLDHWPSDAATAEPHRMNFCFVLARGLEAAEFLAWRDGVTP